MQKGDERRRVAIERVEPTIDGGRFPIKRVVGDQVRVEADIFVEGHDLPAAVLLHRRSSDATWQQVPMRPIGNDRWQGAFSVDELGRYEFGVEAWVDRWATWRRALTKRIDADQDIRVELLVGADLIEGAAGRASGDDAARLVRAAHLLRAAATPISPQAGVAAAGERGTRTAGSEIALADELDEVVRRYPDRRFATRVAPGLEVDVDRPLARFSTWYELFPRSAATEKGRHGTLSDVERRLPDIAAMGFDVLYLPPIHPIGRVHRKGRNNAVTSLPDDVGSPWAIGSEEGGHTAIHPALGTLEDFEGLIDRARALGLEVAMDLALQCAPDHPWVREHPEWFRHRPDGSIQFAENPPKQYQDIFPLDFETDSWEALWHELERVVLFWLERGVRVFRVDNPHTKPFRFWEWLIGSIRARHPETLFLAEAFTRPRVMYHLAKLGFSQSYTYFAWRNTAAELRQYLTELTATSVREFFRPNFWPNTQDILTEYLQTGGRPAFVVRLLLAATLGASYGIYGPPFELLEAEPREPGSEEYLDSEKYQLRHWDTASPHSLVELITRVNRIRHEHPALQRNDTLRFHETTNEQLLCYSKTSADGGDVILVIANVDPHHVQRGFVDLDLERLGIQGEGAFQAHDLLAGARFLWHGARNYVELDPQVVPAHILAVRRRVRTEHDFEYFF